MNVIKFQNPSNQRFYLLEYGIDLFGQHIVRTRYGVKLGSSTMAIVQSKGELEAKIEAITNKRLASGYEII